MADEWIVRATAFVAVLAAMAGWETLDPRRPGVLPRFARWRTNLALVAVNTLVLRALFPVAAVGAAVYAEQHDLGLLNRFALPYTTEVVLAFVALDLAIYGQHVLMHAVPVLWRLHRVHHADLDFDVTTGLRFHPIEIVLSMAFKCVLVVALGAAPLAVLLFETLLNLCSMFNHGNVSLPPRADRLLRGLLVTPDMHRVHHSIVRAEHDRNFGFCLSWWDRLFRTYLAAPAAGHDAMTIGIESHREERDCARLRGMLTLPFR